METPGGTQDRLQQLRAVLGAEISLEDLGQSLRLSDQEILDLGSVGRDLTGAATVHVVCRTLLYSLLI